MRTLRHIFQMKEQRKNPYETEISNLPAKEFKVIVIQMLTKLENRRELSENFN